MNPRYTQVAERAGHRCEYCQAPEGIFNMPFEVEHIVPLSRGGTDDESNWGLSCRSCNLFKGDHLAGVDSQTGAAVPLFHPRRHRWPEHFSVQTTTGSLLGLTPIGRATIELLQLNREVQLAARRQWMRLRLFPPALK